jgi:peptidoglycan hydrolase CwlO-like protein
MRKIFYLLIFTPFIISCNKFDVKKIKNKIDSIENLENRIQDLELENQKLIIKINTIESLEYRIQDLELENQSLRLKINSIEEDIKDLDKHLMLNSFDLEDHKYYDH